MPVIRIQSETHLVSVPEYEFFRDLLVKPQNGTRWPDIWTVCGEYGPDGEMCYRRPEHIGLHVFGMFHNDVTEVVAIWI